MAKEKKNTRNKTSKSSVKVGDLAPKANPKGGAFDSFNKITVAPSPTIKLADGSVVPNPAYVNFQKV